MTTQQKPESTGLIEDLLWRFGDAEFDERAGLLKMAGVEIELEPRPLEVLAYLLRHAGEVVTKEELLEAVWHRRPELISDKVLTNAIGKLRRELKDEQEAIITTLPRRGYRLSVPVSRVVVGRRAMPKLDFKPGEKVPRREQWRLMRALDVSLRSEVWLAEHEKTRTRRVFKFSADGARLSALKREVTLSRVLVESLGGRADFVPVLEWNFEGAPYFIECDYGGDNWLQWAEAQGGLGSVPLATRLDLFAQAADAIGAAHGVGVLHKDIKPANLLIATKPDGGWQVRVTDFGSGRLMEPGRLEELGITRLGFTQTQAVSSDSLTGTPLYLAPELLAGQSPTQASDVYALGVLLYQLLVGDFKKPLSAGWEREVEEELLREDIALAAAGDAELRLDSARALAQRVAQLPHRRLERSAALRQAEEVETARQSLARLRQKRPWAIALGLSMAAGLSASLVLLYQTREARDLAQRELTAAEAVTHFLQTSLIAKASPYAAGKADMSVREAVDAAAADVDVSFAQQPLLAAATHRSLGLAYRSLTLAEPAERHLTRAVALYVEQLGMTADETLRSRIDLALEHSRNSRFDRVRTELEAVRRAGGGQSAAIRAAYGYAEGNLAIHEGRPSDAVKHYQQSLQQAELAPSTRVEALLNTRYNLAVALARTGQQAEAAEVQRELLRLTTRRYGPDHPETLDIRIALAMTLLLAKQHKTALPELEAAFADAERILGTDHERTLDVLGSLAECFDELGQHEAAVARSAERLRRARSKLGAAPPDRLLMSSLIDYGSQLARQGRASEALAPLREGAFIARTLFGEQHGYHHIALLKLASAHLDLGDTASARPVLAKIEAAQVIELTGWKGWDGQLSHQRGRARELSGDRAGALALYQQALSQLEAVREADDNDLQATRKALARLTLQGD